MTMKIWKLVGTVQCLLNKNVLRIKIRKINSVMILLYGIFQENIVQGDAASDFRNYNWTLM